MTHKINEARELKMGLKKSSNVIESSIKDLPKTLGLNKEVGVKL